MITEDELIQALREAQEAGPQSNGLSAQEIMEATGWNIRRVRAALKGLSSKGSLVVGRKYAPGIDGRRSQIPCYTIKP